MKKILLHLSFYAAAGCAFAQNPHFAWARQTSTNGDPGAGNVGCVAVDTVNQYVYTVGYFTGGGINFGSGELNGSSGSKSVYLSKYNLGGGLVWARSFPSPHDNIATGVAVDRSGNVLVTGYSQDDTVRFGSQFLINSHPHSTDHTVAYVAKLDGSGNTIWLKGSAGGGGILSNAIALDASNNVFITGMVVDNSGSFLGNNSLTLGAFVMKLSSSTGNSLWLSQILPSSALASEGNSIGIDHSGNCVLVGAYSTDITLGTLSLSGGNGSLDRFITSLDGGTGAFTWASGNGTSPPNDVNVDVSVDSHDNVFITGYEAIGNNPANQFVEKYDASGTYYWHNSYENNIAPGPQSITSDNAGNCYVAYNVSDTTVYGSYTVTTHSQFSAGSSVTAIVKIDNTGNVLFAKSNLDVPMPLSLSQCFGIAMDTQGFLYIGCSLYGEGGYDATTLNTGSYTEAVLAKLGSSVTAGIAGQSKAGAVSVFPNPSSSAVYVGQLNTKVKYSVADMQGRMVLSGSVSPDENRIDISAVPAGVYILELTGNGAPYHQKIIIEK